MRQMYDSVTAGNIPTTAAMVAGYLDGLYRWSTADWARFPNAVKVQIAISASTNAGHVLDCEWGDATPAQCPGWVVRRRKAGCDPSVYCTTGNWPSVRAAFAANRVAEPRYWVAAYPGDGPTVPPGAVAHQWLGGMTAPFDTSVVADYWAGVDPVKPPVKPSTGAPAYPGYPTSTKSFGSYVTLLIQHRLIVLGYVYVVADGVFGSKTAGWVGLFQSRHGISADGVVGPATWAALFT